MRWLGLVVVVMSFVACGGKGSQGGNAAEGGAGSDSGVGSSGTGGAAGKPSGPPAQGAFIVTIGAISPAAAGKACPVGAAFTSEVPSGGGLDADTYLNKVVDGEEAASVTCSITGASTFQLSGTIATGVRQLVIEDGELGADRKGTAKVSISNAEQLSSALSGTCALDFSKSATTSFQIKAGSAWGAFSCNSVESPPSDACAAQGIVVLENCAQN
jgi:hypothetical protein